MYLADDMTPNPEPELRDKDFMEYYCGSGLGFRCLLGDARVKGNQALNQSQRVQVRVQYVLGFRGLGLRV